VISPVGPDILLGDVKIGLRRQLCCLHFQFPVQAFRADFGAILEFQASWREIRRGNLDRKLAALPRRVKDMKAVRPETERILNSHILDVHGSCFLEPCVHGEPEYWPAAWIPAPDP